MSANIVRNAVTLLLILTLANLAASFAALRAVQTIRDDSRQKLQRLELTTAYLDATVATLCARTDTACPPAPERQ